MTSATFGAGCFWGVEARFRRVPGVTSAAVGYAGGDVENPTYEQVCSVRTGHAEVLQVENDTARVSYDALLDVFWEAHEPTQLDPQGPDVGRQYRSAIFTHDQEQADAAAASKAKLEQTGRYRQPVVTEITPLERFWRAEDYHQQYLEKRGLRRHAL
jgi:peptide-methionine (S)-S-oxide reductase